MTIYFIRPKVFFRKKLQLTSSCQVTDLCAADGVLTQVDTRRLAVLQTACGDIRKQVLQALVLAVDFHGRHPYREASASLLLALVDELEQPGDGTGRNAKVLHGAV